MKKIAIIGSTGSIGVQTLEVVRESGNLNVVVLCCNSNIKLLEEQVREFNPKYAVVLNKARAKELSNNIKDLSTRVLTGMDGIIEACTYKDVEMVVNSAVGIAGMIPTIECIKNKKDIALANKETLVTAGEIVMKMVKEYGVKLYPIDSEHSAIFQALQGNTHNKIEKLILTASGGPFRGYKKADLEKVKLEDALKHPNWSMGSKITIDSATLMNKGLEVIEAKWLFDVSLEQIEVVIHPQSILHSAVQYEDGSIIGQMGLPDMKLPIQYAINYPNRLKNSFKRINLFEHKLTFEKPDTDTFKGLGLAYEALRIGKTAPVILNGANEKAVELFLNKKISFLEISDLVEEAMRVHKLCENLTIENIIEADKWARKYVDDTALGIVKK